MLPISRTLSLLLAVCLRVGVSLAATPAALDNPPVIVVEASIRTLRTADFDGDRKLDFAVLVRSQWEGWTRFCVYGGNGDGTFRTPRCSTLSTVGADLFDTGILDGDAIPDIVTSRRDVDGNVFLQAYRGNGDGTFTPSGSELAGATFYERFILADVTGDERPDIVDVTLRVRPGLGDGTFGAAIGSVQGGYSNIYAVDANRDGRLDIVGEMSPQTSIHYGTGNGTFLNPIYVEYNGAGISAMADFDGSGRADIAFIRDGLVLHLASSTGDYSSRTKHDWVTAAAVTAADMNGDGRPDLVAAGHTSVSVWLMGAGGVPAPRRIFSTASTASFLNTGDFDGDGSVDVLVGGAGDAFDDHDVVSLLRGSRSGDLDSGRAYAMSRFVDTDWGGYYVGGAGPAAVSDVTGNGVSDLIMVGKEIAVFEGLGAGRFADVAVRTTSLPSDAFGLAAYADYNGDGALDILLQTNNLRMYCFLASGDGTYAQSAILPSVSGPVRGGAGDFNGDGRADFAYHDNGQVTLFAGRGDGTFDEPRIAPYTASYMGFRVGDVNNDGRDDLVYGGTVLLGQTSGAFTTVQYEPWYYEPPAVLADLNEDGKLDIVLARADGSALVRVTVMEGRGDGTFGPRRVILSPSAEPDPSGTGTTTGDFNDDGHVDLAFGPSLLFGDGAGWFRGYQRFRDPETEGSLTIADADGNGSDDLLFAGQAVKVVLTRTTDSLDLPISLAIETAPASLPAGSTGAVTVRATGLTTLAPSGAVVISVGGVVAGLAILVDGVARANITGYVGGTQLLEARYSGDDVYAAVDAPSRALEITPAITSLGTTITPRSGVTTRDVVRIQGTVNSPLEGVSGTVALYLDGVLVGTQPAPPFDFTVGPMPDGWHRARLEYSGDSMHLPATSPDFLIKVIKPLIAMSVAVNPPLGTTLGSPVTVTVTFPEEPALSGTVTIRADNLSFPASIVDGVATLTTSALPPTSLLTVVYPGNAVYAATSRKVGFTVTDLPSPSGPTDLYLITPCRLFDTRESYGLIGEDLTLFAVRRCGVPDGARAIAANVTVVDPSGIGYLTLHPGAGERPYASTINYRTGKTRANSAILALSQGGRFVIHDGGPPVHVIIDITGYFR